MANDYNNVSVRLNSTDYKKLEYIHNKYNKMSYGKVSLADVLRIAVNDLYDMEIEKDDSIQQELEKQRTKENEQPEKVLEQLEKVQAEAEQQTAPAKEETKEETSKPAPKTTARNSTQKKRS